MSPVKGVVSGLRDYLWNPLFNPMACLPQTSLSAEQDAEALLKRLEAILRNQIRQAVSGENKSVLKGQGLDFADLREYMPGDDIRKIDWNVFARTLSPHVREYQEEKQLTLWLVLDMTPSMHFGKTRTKLQQSIELAGLFALLANRANHKLGAFLMTGDKPEIIAPKAGYIQVQRITKAMLDGVETIKNNLPQALSSMDPLTDACHQLGHLVPKSQKNATVLFFSDFLSLAGQPETPGWQIPMGRLAQHARMIYVFLQDAVEQVLPTGLGLLHVKDPETGLIVSLDTNDINYQTAYEAHSQRQATRVKQVLANTGGTVIDTLSDDPLAQVLLRLIAAKVTKRRVS